MIGISVIIFYPGCIDAIIPQRNIITPGLIPGGQTRRLEFINFDIRVRPRLSRKRYYFLSLSLENILPSLIIIFKF